MAQKILDARQLETLHCEIEEACCLINTLIELEFQDGDGATPMRTAIVHLARRSGWLLDRCSSRLGHPGVRGPEWIEWCGGSPNEDVKRVGSDTASSAT
jgi:hypothetical protein